MFVGVAAEKLVGGLFAKGPNLFKKFHKVEIYSLSGKISTGKSFRWKKFLSPFQYFFIFPRQKVLHKI